MKENNSGLLKKIKGKWVAVIISGGIAVGAGGVLTNNGVLAEVNSAAVSMMSTINSTDFKNKDTYIQDKSIQDEAKASVDKITSFWSFNSVEEVRNEIARQAEAGLDVYVVQWGDTLSVLAEATNTSVSQLAEQNNINNWNLILTGDLLTGILKTSSSSSNQDASDSNQYISDTSQPDGNHSERESNNAETVLDEMAINDTYSEDLVKQDRPEGVEVEAPEDLDN